MAEIKRAGCFVGDNPEKFDDVCKKNDCLMIKECIWKLEKDDIPSDLGKLPNARGKMLSDL